MFFVRPKAFQHKSLQNATCRSDFWELSSNSEKPLPDAVHARWLQDPWHDFIPLPDAVHARWLQDPWHDFIFETGFLHQIRFGSQHWPYNPLHDSIDGTHDADEALARHHLTVDGLVLVDSSCTICDEMSTSIPQDVGLLNWPHHAPLRCFLDNPEPLIICCSHPRLERILKHLLKWEQEAARIIKSFPCLLRKEMFNGLHARLTDLWPGRYDPVTHQAFHVLHSHISEDSSLSHSPSDPSESAVITLSLTVIAKFVTAFFATGIGPVWWEHKLALTIPCGTENSGLAHSRFPGTIPSMSVVIDTRVDRQKVSMAVSTDCLRWRGGLRSATVWPYEITQSSRKGAHNGYQVPAQISKGSTNSEHIFHLFGPLSKWCCYLHIQRVKAVLLFHQFRWNIGHHWARLGSIVRLSFCSCLTS